jgi:hypothetical protein
VAHAGERRGKEKKRKRKWAGLREGWTAFFYSFSFSFLFLYSNHSNHSI